MATENNTTAPLIRRYLVVVNGDHVARCARSRDEARLELRKEASAPYRRGQRIGLREYVLEPNEAIIAFGVERFDAMLSDIGNNSITLIGTLDELIACGAIGSYILDILGKSGSKSSCDEFGTNYSVRKRGRHRHELHLCFSDEPQIPDGNALRPIGFTIRDPDDIDISDILARLQAKRGA